MQLTREEERDLIYKYQKTNCLKSRNIILDNHMGLIHTLAVKITKDDFLKEELIQEGVIGVIKCLERFDLSKGLSISCYAGSCARGAMLDYLKPARKMQYEDDYDIESIYDDSSHNPVLDNVLSDKDSIWLKTILSTFDNRSVDCVLSNYKEHGDMKLTAKKHNITYKKVASEHKKILKILKREHEKSS
jgi:RNA polymerase sigma factor (sigma-70 family)